MGSFYRKQLEDYLKTIDINTDIVYDIGGKQYPIDKKRTKSFKVKNYKILDIPEYDLNEPLEFPGQADIIFCLEVFEYLINPMTAMKNISKALKPNGIAYISFPLTYPVHQEVEFDSLRYTETGVKRLAEKAGLKTKHVHYRKTKTGTLYKYYIEDGMRGAKGKDHHITGYIFTLTK